MTFDIVVIGGGPAGLAAAIEAKNMAPELSVLILERDSHLGGILQQCIHNGFGLHYFKEELTGPEYAQRFIDRLDGSGIEVWNDAMVLDLTKDREITCVSKAHGLVTVQAQAVVLAMGCRERTRGALNIPGSRPAGIYTAGSAQRLTNMEGFLPGKCVVVLGSGDIGLIMARRMVWSGAKVALVAELMPYSSGLNRNIVQCLVDNRIPLKFNHTVTKIHGKQRVEAVTVAEVDPRTRQPIEGTEQRIECDTLLLSVGLIPENELSMGAGLALDPATGGASVDEHRETEIPGIFACGNVLHVHDLVDNVSEEAQIAGRAAAEHARGRAGGGASVAVEPGTGVRYVVPQRISADGEGKMQLYFRVGDVYRGARLRVRCGEQILLDKKMRVMTPGEMEKVEIDRADITGPVRVEVVEGA